jgi:hypothetical protein
MAGLGRIQQKFNAAVITLLSLAGLRNMAAAGDASKQAAAGYGHPIHAKLLKSSNPNANTPGRPYQGYCSGAGETARRAKRHDAPGPWGGQ